MDISSSTGGLDILDIKRGKQGQWVLDCAEGEIAFHSGGYRQHIRQQPTYQGSRWFRVADRGGYSFATGLDSATA